MSAKAAPTTATVLRKIRALLPDGFTKIKVRNTWSNSDCDAMSTTEDASDFWKDYKHASKVKRSSNRAHGAAILSRAGLAYESKNSGAHLVVERSVDYWPGTGKWIARNGRDRGRGVHKLIKWLGANRDQ